MLCGPRVASEDRTQYVLQSELLGPAPREEGSSDSGDEFLIVNADWLNGAVPLRMQRVPPLDTPCKSEMDYVSSSPASSVANLDRETEGRCRRAGRAALESTCLLCSFLQTRRWWLCKTMAPHTWQKELLRLFAQNQGLLLSLLIQN